MNNMICCICNGNFVRELTEDLWYNTKHDNRTALILGISSANESKPYYVTPFSLAESKPRMIPVEELRIQKVASLRWVGLAHLKTNQSSKSYLDSLQEYSTGEFQALQLIVLEVFGTAK